MKLWFLIFKTKVLSSSIPNVSQERAPIECLEDMIDNNDISCFHEQFLNFKTTYLTINTDQGFTNSVCNDEKHSDEVYDNNNTTCNGVKRKSLSPFNNSPKKNAITEDEIIFKINEYYKVIYMVVKLINNMIDLFYSKTIEKIYFEHIYEIDYIIILDNIISNTILKIKNSESTPVLIPIDINNHFNIYANELISLFCNDLECKFHPIHSIMRMFRYSIIETSYKSLLCILFMEIQRSPKSLFELNNVIVLAFLGYDKGSDDNSFSTNQYNSRNIFLFKIIIILKVANTVLKERQWPNHVWLINKTIKKALIALVFDKYSFEMEAKISRLIRFPKNWNPQKQFWFSFHCDYFFVISYIMNWNYRTMKRNLYITINESEELRDNYKKMFNKALFYFEDLSNILLNKNK
ncbi:hypothetical protein NGRA_1102 [Nosema granulosis]|uniref:Uncharacterized protein n=1 Tax=Nosema granulosis TaxID=83296 RepID=A0A9P6H0Q3_9MICR|nr:hypothetical protein NGRA_1102 [Nosema granulosis]